MIESSSLRKACGIEDDSGGDDGHDFGMQDAGGQQRQLVGVAVEDDRVPGVVAALIADDDVVLVGQQIDDFPLGFVTPLQTDHRGGGHEIASSVFRRTPEEERPAGLFGS